MHFEKAKSLINPKHEELYEKIVWSTVWNAKTLGTYGKAIKILSEFEQNATQSVPQFSYWKARILEEKGNTHLATKHI